MYLWRDSTFVFLLANDINSRQDAEERPSFAFCFCSDVHFLKEIKFVMQPFGGRRCFIITKITFKLRAEGNCKFCEELTVTFGCVMMSCFKEASVSYSTDLCGCNFLLRIA